MPWKSPLSLHDHLSMSNMYIHSSCRASYCGRNRSAGAPIIAAPLTLQPRILPPRDMHTSAMQVPLTQANLPAGVERKLSMAQNWDSMQQSRSWILSPSMTEKMLGRSTVLIQLGCLRLASGFLGLIVCGCVCVSLSFLPPPSLSLWLGDRERLSLILSLPSLPLDSPPLQAHKQEECQTVPGKMRQGYNYRACLSAAHCTSVGSLYYYCKRALSPPICVWHEHKTEWGHFN